MRPIFAATKYIYELRLVWIYVSHGGILIWWFTVRHKLYARYFIFVCWIFLSSRSVSSWIYSVHNRVYACVRFVFLESEQRLPVIYHRIRKKGKDAEMIFVCIFLTENIYFTAYYVNLITIACSQWIVWCVNFGYMLYLGKRFSLLFLPLFPIVIQRFDAFLFECNHFGSFCWFFFVFLFPSHAFAIRLVCVPTW